MVERHLSRAWQWLRRGFAPGCFPSPSSAGLQALSPAVICPGHPTIADSRGWWGGLDPGHRYVSLEVNQPSDELGHNTTQAKH